MSSSSETKTIVVRYVTWDRLKSLGRKGETFDEIITRLIQREEAHITGD